MDEYYSEELTGKEILFKIIISLLIVVCAVILGMYLLNKNSLHVNKEIKYEVGSKLSKNVKDYVTSRVISDSDFTITVEGYKLGDTLDKTGDFKYTVKTNNSIKEGTIKVVDTKAPTVTVEDITVGVDEDYKLDYFLVSCEDYSLPCNVTLKNDLDYKAEGTYDLTLVISDNVGNKVEKDAKLTIKDGYSRKDIITRDTKIVSNSNDDKDLSDNDIFIKFDKAYNPDEEDNEAEEFLYEIISDDMNKYIPSNYSGNYIVDQEIIELYNKNHFIVGYAFKVTLSNGEVTYLKYNN